MALICICARLALFTVKSCEFLLYVVLCKFPLIYFHLTIVHTHNGKDDGKEEKEEEHLFATAWIDG